MTGILSFVSIILFLLISPTFSAKNSYVVYLGAHNDATTETKAELSSVYLDARTQSHYDFLGSFLGSKLKAKDSIYYSYTKHINGFAAILDDDQAAEISRHPDVVSVFLNKAKKLHTTRSWEFMGLENNGIIPPSSAWEKASYGEDTIIANLDTGVWPESRSFSDEGFGPVPSRFKGPCDNGKDSTFKCNKKLLGARYFNKGFATVAGPLNSTYESPRDYDGHGSHTLSTAGGNFVAGANIFGFANGTAKGGSPKARVAAYKVCWPSVGDQGGCFDSDILAAFDNAISDGVDVISVSVGGSEPSPISNDSIAIGAFHAIKNGISVVCSAGNAGPTPGTVTNLAPWIISVGASTIDRTFPSYVILGNKKHYTGQSLSSKKLPLGKFFPLVLASSVKADHATPENAILCLDGTLDPKKAKGKILVCLRGDIGRVAKGIEAASAGAAGMVLINDESTGDELLADAHVLPASHITYSDGLALLSYINSTKSPIAHITSAFTKLGTKPAPFMASFSSVGPNLITPEILKPDITGPGVSILAAYTGAADPDSPRIVKFNVESGTSMSCPHISGVVGLLKTLYPHWSPAAIQSAIMTTAYTRDNEFNSIKNGSLDKATPFSYGSGHVRPNEATDPGLVYDASVNDYVTFLCSLDEGKDKQWIKSFVGGSFKCPSKPIELFNLNYPSITIPSLNGSVEVIRTVKNVGSPGTYTSCVSSPAGVSVDVEPNELTFSKIGEEKSFKVIVSLRKGSNGADSGYVFGSLAWSDGKHTVRSPIAVNKS